MYRPAIKRPRVLLVVAHPGVGGGLETLLRLERRYDVRRATRLQEAAQLARSWRADAALVDAEMLPAQGKVVLGIPALVLVANDTEGELGARALDDPRRSIAKDAPGQDLVAAVEHLLTSTPEAPAGQLAIVAIGVLLVVFVALLLYLAWTAIV